MSVCVYIYTHIKRRREPRSVNTVETDTWRDISTVCIIPYQERRSLVSTPVDDSNPLRRTKNGGRGGGGLSSAKRKRFSLKRGVCGALSAFRGGGEKGRARGEASVLQGRRGLRGYNRPIPKVVTSSMPRLFCAGTGSAVPNSTPPDLSASRITSTH